MTPFAHGKQSRRVHALQIIFCCIPLILALQLPSYADEPRSLTISPKSGPVGTKATVRGTGWDPEYYSGGVRIGFYQNFGNGVLTPIADEIRVPPDPNGRFNFDYTIPDGFEQGDVFSISGLIGNGGGERANFTVTAGQQEGSGTAIAGPDLQPTAIKYDPAAAQPNDTIHFDVGVKNNGEKKAGSFNVKWLVDGEDVGAYGNHGGIPGGTTVLDGNSQFDWTPKQAGVYKITFTADTDNHVAETEESNNSQSVTVTVEGSKSSLAFEYPLHTGPHAESHATYGIPNRFLKDRGSCFGSGHRFPKLTHAGEDWFRPVGTPVYSVATGKVVTVLKDFDNADALIIEHQLPNQQAWGSNKIYSVYLHGTSRVTVGQLVDTNTVIANIEGYPENRPHLHWEIRKLVSMKDASIPKKCKIRSGDPGPGYTDVGTNPDDFGYINPSRWVQEN
jgi:hypothetical protein